MYMRYNLNVHMLAFGRVHICTMNLSERLVKNLKARRGQQAQEEFVRKLGISRATLNRLESASQNTTLKTLGQIVKSSECDIE
jgi:transcriptional regulator with XRE-family HTH domain